MVTLENTSETIKRVQTYLDRDMTSSDIPTAVLQADTSESKAILALKAELTTPKDFFFFKNLSKGSEEKDWRGKKERREKDVVM